MLRLSLTSLQCECLASFAVISLTRFQFVAITACVRESKQAGHSRASSMVAEQECYLSL